MHVTVSTGMHGLCDGLISSVLLASAMGALLQWRFYRRTRNWWPPHLSTIDSAILQCSLAAVLAWPLLPVLALAVFLAFIGAPFLSWTVTILGTAAFLVITVLDLDSYAICGFHLVNYRSFITLDTPGRWIGGYRRLTPMVYRSALAGLVQAALSVALALFQSMLPPAVLPVSIVALILILISPAMLFLLDRPTIGKRLFDMTFHRPWLTWRGLAADTNSGQLHELRRFAEERSKLFRFVAETKSPALQSPPTPAPPSLLLLVIDSWRADTLCPERMPKLFARSRHGLCAERHYSNGNATHTGMFSLLYGRLPLLMKSTFRVKSPPALVSSLRAQGYSTHVRALQTNWFGLDQIFAAEHYDEIENIASEDDFAKGDLQTLSFIKQRLTSPANPVFVLGHLLAPHFPYYLPSSLAAKSRLNEDWNFSGFQTTHLHSPGHQMWRDRYHESLRWLDEEIDHLLDRLDLTRTLVAITGDHGESHGEDGTWLHASRLSEVQTRTPLLIFGAGVPTTRITSLSSAVDVAPTLMQLLGQNEPLHHWQGGSLLNAHPDPAVHVCDFAQRGGCLIQSASEDRLKLVYGTQQTRWSISGFMDEQGDLQPEDWTPRDPVQSWKALIEREFSALERLHPETVK